MDHLQPHKSLLVYGPQMHFKSSIRSHNISNHYEHNPLWGSAIDTTAVKIAIPIPPYHRPEMDLLPSEIMYSEWSGGYSKTSPQVWTSRGQTMTSRVFPIIHPCSKS